MELAGNVARALEISAALKRASAAGQAWAAARVKAKAEEQDRRMANVERMAVETNATLKLVAMRLGVTPITLEPAKDGGQ